MNKYYTYIVRCEDNSLYTGITTDLNRRLKEHQEKGKLGAKYTHNHTVVAMEVAFSSKSRSYASKLEYAIKHLTKEEKENIIRTKSLEVLKEKLELEEYKIVEKI